MLVVRPKKFGYFNFTSAEVRYKSGEDGGVTKMGFSSDPGQGLIIALKDYERQFSAHMVSWNISIELYSRHNNFFRNHAKIQFYNVYYAFQLDWVAFAAMTLPSLGIPFLLWHSSKSKYESIKLSKGEWIYFILDLTKLYLLQLIAYQVCAVICPRIEMH